MNIRFVVVTATAQAMRQFGAGHTVTPGETGGDRTVPLITEDYDIGVVLDADCLIPTMVVSLNNNVEGDYHILDEDTIDDLKFEVMDLLGTLATEEEDGAAGKFLELLTASQDAIDDDEATVVLIWNEA